MIDYPVNIFWHGKGWPPCHRERSVKVYKQFGTIHNSLHSQWQQDHRAKYFSRYKCFRTICSLLLETRDAFESPSVPPPLSGMTVCSIDSVGSLRRVGALGFPDVLPASADVPSCLFRGRCVIFQHSDNDRRCKVGVMVSWCVKGLRWCIPNSALSHHKSHVNK